MALNIKNMIGEFFQQDDGGFSCKRLVIIGSVLLLFAGFICNMVFKMHIDEFIFNSIKEIVMVTTGITGLEKFGNAFGGNRNKEE